LAPKSNPSSRSTPLYVFFSISIYPREPYKDQYYAHRCRQKMLTIFFLLSCILFDYDLVKRGSLEKMHTDLSFYK
jgi:hypothetical protein